MGQDIELYLPVWGLFAMAMYSVMKLAWMDFDRLAKGPPPSPASGARLPPGAGGAGGLLLAAVGALFIATGLAALRGLLGSASQWFRSLVVPGVVFWAFSLFEACRSVAAGRVSAGNRAAAFAIGFCCAYAMWFMPAFEVACAICMAVGFSYIGLLGGGLLCLVWRKRLPPEDDRAAANRRFACAVVPLLAVLVLLTANLRTILGGAWLVREGEMALRSGIAATTMGPWITAETLDAGFHIPDRLGYYSAGRTMALIRAGEAGRSGLIRSVREAGVRGKILAIVHLERRRAADPEEISALADALADEDVWVRSAAAHALGKIGAHARWAVPKLILALSDGSAEVRAAAAQSLGRIGADDAASLDALRRALSDQFPDVARSASEALDKLGRSAP